MSQRSTWRSNSNESRKSNISRISKSSKPSSKNVTKTSKFEDANDVLISTNIPNNNFIAKSRKLVDSINFHNNNGSSEEDDESQENETDTSSSYWAKWRSKTDNNTREGKSVRASFSSINTNDKNKNGLFLKDDSKMVKAGSQSSLTSMGWFSNWRKNQNYEDAVGYDDRESRNQSREVFQEDVERDTDPIMTQRSNDDRNEEELLPTLRILKPGDGEKSKNTEEEDIDLPDVISAISKKSTKVKSISRSHSKGSIYDLEEEPKQDNKYTNVITPMLDLKKNDIRNKSSINDMDIGIPILNEDTSTVNTMTDAENSTRGKSAEQQLVNENGVTWWNSIFTWKSGVSEYPESPMSEVDDSLESEDVRKMRKILHSYSEDDHSCWAISSVDLKLANGGELSILGTPSETCPVIVYDKLKRTKMEHHEYDARENSPNLKNPKVVPKFDQCYRDITMNTQARLFLDSLICKSASRAGKSNNSSGLMSAFYKGLSGLVPIERHVYHERISIVDKNKSRDGTTSGNTSIILMKKKILVVDIQQFVPQKLQDLISDKFSGSTRSNKAVQQAILDWNLGAIKTTKTNNDEENSSECEDIDHVEIETILLRGKGTILQQMENFFTILTKNWIFKFDKCDYLLFVGNFMACNIAVHLLKKLIDKYTRIFDKIDKIGMICVNGTFNGLVHPDINGGEGISGVKEDSNEGGKDNEEDKMSDKVDSSNIDKGNSESKLKKKKSLESGTSGKQHLDYTMLKELKKLSDPESELSYRLNHDLKVLLSKPNFKIGMIGKLEESINAIYSSLCLQFQHPNITRMVFFDSYEENLKLSKFVIKLIEVCLMLRNLGYEDYNFLVYLSKYLNDFYRLNANKQNGNGSKNSSSKDTVPNGSYDGKDDEKLKSVYECKIAYREAIKFCFETTRLHTNGISDTSISQSPVVVEDEDQMEERKALQQEEEDEIEIEVAGSESCISNRGGNDILSIKGKRADRGDIMKFQKVDFVELIKKFNNFHYPWMLNKLVKEIYRVNGLHDRMSLLPIAQHSNPIISTNEQNVSGNIIEEEDIKAWNDLTRHGFEDAYDNYKEHLGHFYLYFTGKKYKDNFTAIDNAEKSLKGKYFEFAADWKNSKPKINTLQGGIFICLNTTIDPPDLARMGNPRAISEGWINPYEHRGTHIQAASLVADIICKQYKSITLKTNFKPFPDAIIDDIKKVLNQWRRNYRDTLNSTGVTNRYLFHYNGHGVPAPTESGELWVFNRHYSQYIPVPVSDLQTWLGAPSVFVFDCSKAGYLVNCFKQSAQLKIDNYNEYMKQLQEQQNNPHFQNMENQPQNHHRQQSDHYDSDGSYYNDSDTNSMHNSTTNPNNNSSIPNINSGIHPSNPSYLFDCYQFAACQADELLPTAPELPADLFTCCMTSPIEISVKFFLLRNQELTKYFDGLFNRDTITLSSDFKYKPLKLKDFDVSYFKRTSDKKDQIADLLYIYTSITDTIAYTSVPRTLFRKCFRSDNTVTVLFRNFFLAQRIMKYYNCNPISEPELPDCHEHELWKHWDMAIEHFLTSLIELKELNPQKSVSIALAEAPRYIFSNFFDASLDYLKNWIQYGNFTMVPPPQLTLILQLLLTPKYRARALKLLAFFVDLGPWAVSLALNIGVFPYVVKLLQSPVVQLKPMLTFVWCKLLACDYKNMQYELYASNGGCFKYFYYMLLPNEEKLNEIQVKHKSAYFESIDRQSKEQKRIVEAIGKPSMTVFRTNDKSLFESDVSISVHKNETIPNTETEKNIKLMSMGSDQAFMQLFNESKSDVFEMIGDDDGIFMEEGVNDDDFSLVDFEKLPHKWIDFEKDKGFTKYHLTTALVVLTLFIKDFGNARERLVDANLYFKVIELIEKGRKTSRQLQLWGALFLSECLKDCTRAKLVFYETNILPRLISVFNDEISISDLRAAIIRCFTNFLTIYPEGDTSIKTTKESDQLETRLAEEVMSATYDAASSVRKEMVIFLSSFVYKHLPLFKLAAYASLQEEIVLVEAHNDLFEFRSKTKIYGTVFSAAWKAILILSSDSHDEVQNKSEQIIIYVFNSLRTDSNLKEPFEFCYDYLVEKSLNHDRNSRSGYNDDNDDSRSLLDVQLSRLSSRLSGNSDSGRRVASAYGSFFGVDQNGSDSESVHSSYSGMQSLSISNFIKTMAGYGLPLGSHEGLSKVGTSDKASNKKRSNSFGSAAGTHFKSIQPTSYNVFDGETYGSLPHPLPPRFKPMDLQSEKPVIPIKSDLLDFATEYYQFPQLSSWPDNDPLIDEFDIKFGKWRQSRNDACIANSQRDKQLSVSGDWSVPLTTINTTSKIFEFTQFDSFLVTSDGKDVINVWDYEKNKSVCKFSNNNPVGTKISQLEFMNEDDVPILIVGSNDGTVKLYNNFDDLNRCRLISSWQTLSNMTWSNNGTNFVFEWVQARGDLVATGNVKTINLWSALREQCYKTIPKRSPLPITSLTCDQLEGQIIVAGFSNGDIRVYDKRCKARQEMVKEWVSNKSDKNARSSINNIHLQRGGYRELVSGSNNGLVELWDIRLMDPVETFFTGSLLKTMKVHEHAPIIATGSESVKIWSNAGHTISNFYNDSRNVNLSTKSYFGSLYNGISKAGSSSHKASYITNLALHPHKMIIAASSSSEPSVNIFQATNI